MANVRISELPGAGALGGAEEFPAVQSGATVAIELSVLRDWVESELNIQAIQATAYDTEMLFWQGI